VHDDSHAVSRTSAIDTTSTHGTGCTLSAAVTAGLALGRPLEQAVTDALDFVHRAIAAARGWGEAMDRSIILCLRRRGPQ